jgi:hypothetical protein
MALAVHSGAVVPGRGVAAAGPSAPNVSILPNVKASSGTQPNNETPIAVNPTNTNQVLTGANDYNCPTIQGFFSSDDGGATFPHVHCMASLGGMSGNGDPNVGYNAKYGNAWIAGIQTNASFVGKIVYETSTNNGVSWAAPKVAVNPTFTNGLTDKNWTEIDNNASSPNYGCVYISVTQFDPTFTKEQISVTHSCDNGTTWITKLPGAVTNSPLVSQFSDLGIAKDGTVYASWLQCSATGPAGDCGGTTGTMLYSKSTDAGNTWTAPAAINMAKLAPDSCFCAYYGNIPTTSERVSNIPVIDVDNSSGPNAGRVYVAEYNYTTFMQLQVLSSTNGGATWGAPVKVNPASTSDQYFPWLSVSGTGRVGVTYNLRSTNTYNEIVAISMNGGATWLANKKISTVASKYSDDGFGGGFIGDYTGNAWGGNTLHAVWTDTRTGTGQAWTGGVAF